MALASVLQALSIPASQYTLLHFTQRDQNHNHKRERAILDSQKRRRRQMDARKDTAESSRRRRGNDSAYLTDQFGIEAKDNEICAECQQKDCPIDPKRKIDGWWAMISVKGGSMADVSECLMSRI